MTKSESLCLRKGPEGISFLTFNADLQSIDPLWLTTYEPIAMLPAARKIGILRSKVQLESRACPSIDKALRSHKFGSMSLRDQKKAVRKSMKARLDCITPERATEQCAIVQTVSNVTAKLMGLANNIVTEVLRSSAYKEARRISVFLSMPRGEVSTHDIVVDALKQGKTVFVPYIHKVYGVASEKGSSIMDMLALHSQEDLESLKPDSWGIPSLHADSVAGRENALYPCRDIQAGAENDTGTESPGLDLILVPGVAFDKENGRLGHGKGFYDRYLQRYKEVLSSRKEQRMPILGELAVRV